MAVEILECWKKKVSLMAWPFTPTPLLMARPLREEFFAVYQQLLLPSFTIFLKDFTLIGNLISW